VTARLLVNENFPVPSLQLLRQAGFDVSSVSEVMPGSSDVDVIARAFNEGRWLVTFDRDFGELVYKRSVPPPPAVILLRSRSYQPTDPAAWVQIICADPKAVAGSFIVFDGRSIRSRPLMDQLSSGRR